MRLLASCFLSSVVECVDVATDDVSDEDTDCDSSLWCNSSDFDGVPDECSKSSGDINVFVEEDRTESCRKKRACFKPEPRCRTGRFIFLGGGE